MILRDDLFQQMLKALRMADIVTTHGYSNDGDRKDTRDFIRETFEALRKDKVIL